MAFETINIEMTRAEGAIQRLFGLIERRGFELRSFNMPEHNPSGANDAFQVTVGIVPRDDTRSIDVLFRQINRLHGIRSIGRPVAAAAVSAAPAQMSHDHVRVAETVS